MMLSSCKDTWVDNTLQIERVPKHDAVPLPIAYYATIVLASLA